MKIGQDVKLKFVPKRGRAADADVRAGVGYRSLSLQEQSDAAIPMTVHTVMGIASSASPPRNDRSVERYATFTSFCRLRRLSGRGWPGNSDGQDATDTSPT